MHLLINLAILQTAVYAALHWFDQRFAFGSAEGDRPILLVLTLLAVSFAIYLLALRAATRIPWRPSLGWAILAPALLFRILLAPTSMIQEIDIYRYLWDGAVAAQGVSPYRYAPADVDAADAGEQLPADLRRLVALRDNSREAADLLRRIHYAEIPTVYPPVSQMVFASAYMLTPSGMSVPARVLALKSLLLIFDVGVIGLLSLLLKRVDRSPGWVVAYAWCPLVLKEFANSGHLDSIAVFFSTAAVWGVVEFVVAPTGRSSRTALFGSAAALALGVGAKLYPLILLPVLLAAIGGASSIRKAVGYLAVVGLLSALLTAPMFLTRPAALPAAHAGVETTSDAPTHETGLHAFLTRWEMNDFVFLVLVENLLPLDPHAGIPEAWFSVLPAHWREAIVEPAAHFLQVDGRTAAFLVARAMTGVVFGLIALWLAAKVYRQAHPLSLLEAAFLTLAWFWLLAPTQNPWYWTWVLPLLPFARGRAWYAVSGLSLIYYLRFWLRYHYSDVLVLGTAYSGARFFDFVVTWIEYAPWFAWLVVDAWFRKRSESDAR